MNRPSNTTTASLLHVLQIFSEIAIIGGYLLAMIPLMYLVSWQWVLPLTFVNIFLAYISNNRTTGACLANFIMALLSFIPVVGYVFRIIGILISGSNIVNMKRIVT